MARRERAASEKMELLRQIPLFAGCTPQELARLAQLFDEGWRAAGTVLVREGRPGSEFFVIVEGRAEATLRGGHLATLSSGDFFGEMSLLEVAPRAATVVAETDLSLLVLEPRGFASLLAVAPTVGMKMMRSMSQRLRAIEAVPAAAH
ncbi:MAG: cyclic nucleotide-binding domain-containing protein [Actinomycetota bacterium]